MPPDEFRPWTVPQRYQRQMQRVHLAKIVHKSKPQKWKKTKVFDLGNYFEANKCDVMQYLQMDSGYGFPQIHNHHAEHQQQLGQVHDPVEGAEHRQQLQHEQCFQSRTNSSRLEHPQEPQLPMISGGGTPGSGSAHAGPFVNYMPVPARPTPGQVPPPWLGSPLSVPDEFPAGVFPGPPIPRNGCMLMHFGGYAPPPPVTQHSTPPFGASPIMLGPQPPMPGSLMMPPLGSHPNNNSCTDDQSEVRRMMHANGEDLPADVGTLRYFYNIGVDTHMRLFNGNNPPNTDQPQQQQHQQLQQQQHKQRSDETAGLVANTTPPPSPNAVTTTFSTSSCTSGTEQTGDKVRAPRGKRGAFNKGRTKRPQQLYDLTKSINNNYRMS